MKKKFIQVLLVMCVLAFSCCAFAETAKAVPEVQSKPAAAVENPVVADKNDGVAVIVEHFGNDEAGGSLALKLKENFRKSVLFKLADSKQKSIRIKIVSKSEFSDRPDIGSIYAVIWTFAESEDVVPFYLEQDVGIVNSKDTETTAAKLINRTDKIVTQYKYLLE